MSISYSSRIATRGLTFAVDAANPASLPTNIRRNLIAQPENLSNVLWSKGAIDVALSTSTTAPNGTLTAYSVTEQANSAQHLLSYSLGTVVINDTFTWSGYFKNNTNTTQIVLHTNGEGTATFNISGVLAGTVSANSGAGTLSSSIESVGNSWYRCSAVFKKANTTGTFYVSNQNGLGVYTGATSISYFAWGLQLEYNTAVTPYYSATASSLNTQWNDTTGISRPIANSELTAVEVFAWGGGGAAGGTGTTTFCFGGGGGFAQSTIAITPGVSYTVAVGSGGQLGTQGCVIGVGGLGGTNGTAFGAGGEGTQAGTLPCSGTGGGGGAASLFLNNTTILLAAGGGGGAGGTESPENGTGMGGSGGQNGTAGTGAGANGGTAGAQPTTIGQTGTVIAGDHSGSGGGGGGYLGGNAGINPTADGVSGGGGGGGSNFGTLTLSGFNQIRANSSNSFLTAYSSYATGGSSGNAGGQGIVIIRYVGAPRATGGTITSVDGYTVHTFANTGASTFVVAPPAFDFRSYGTFQNNVTYDSRNSGSLVFDNNTSYVSFPDLSSQTNSPLSVFAWVFLNATPVGTNGIWGHFGVNNNNIHYEINPTATRLRLGDTNKADLPMLAVGSWQFVGFTTTGTAHSYYVNGVLSTTWAGATGTILGSSGAVPSSHMVGRSDAGRVWNGRIAHVAVYTAELTAVEVLNNYNALRGRYGV
jgi:hypothetical protein